MNMNSRAKATWVGIVTILLTGLIHGIEAPDAFEDASYKGWLFVANLLAGVLCAAAMYRRVRWGWWFGFFLAATTAAGYVASRTVGLPGLPAEPDAWLEPAGVASLVVETVFIASFIVSRRRTMNE